MKLARKSSRSRKSSRPCKVAKNRSTATRPKSPKQSASSNNAYENVKSTQFMLLFKAQKRFLEDFLMKGSNNSMAVFTIGSISSLIADLGESVQAKKKSADAIHRVLRLDREFASIYARMSAVRRIAMPRYLQDVVNPTYLKSLMPPGSSLDPSAVLSLRDFYATALSYIVDYVNKAPALPTDPPNEPVATRYILRAFDHFIKDSDNELAKRAITDGTRYLMKWSIAYRNENDDDF